MIATRAGSIEAVQLIVRTMLIAIPKATAIDRKIVELDFKGQVGFKR